MALRRKWVIIGVVVLGVLITGIFLARLQKTPARAATVNTLTTTVTIDASVGETFAPAPSSPAPGMSAQDAWASWARLNGSSATTIPSDVTVQLGLLTLPVGPAGAEGTGGLATYNGEAYTAYNELAYGYSWRSCPASTLPIPVSASNPCIEWLFLDANSGQQIDDTWQQ